MWIRSLNFLQPGEAVDLIPPRKRTSVTWWKFLSEIREFQRIRSFLDVQTSREVFLEQNLTRKLILRSIWPWLVKIHTKSTKNEIFDRKISPKIFFWHRKTKRPESFETRFGKVSRQSEPCSTGSEKFFHR